MVSNYLSKRRQFWTLPPVCHSKKKHEIQPDPSPSPPSLLNVALTVNVLCDPTPFPITEVFQIAKPDPRLWIWKNDTPSPVWQARVFVSADLIGNTYSISLSFYTGIQCPSSGSDWTFNQAFLTSTNPLTLNVGFSFSRLDPDYEPGNIRVFQ